MRLEPNEPICGIRPAALKALLSRERFSTPRAMFALGLDEPQIGATLAALARAGWIAYLGTEDAIDRWETTSLGDRLCASRLIKRFPVAEGRGLLVDVLACARAINAEPMASHRVTQIILFGSVLTASDDDDAGDIDLVVDVGRRSLEPDLLKALIDAEVARMPRHVDFLARFSRPGLDILRRIKRVSRRISLHSSHDLSALSAPHRVIYSYDLDREVEGEADPAIRVLAGKVQLEQDLEPGLPPPSRALRPWPVAPNEPADVGHADDSRLFLAQHLWMTGEPIAAIAERCQFGEGATQAYLASRRDSRPAADIVFDASLEAMLLSALPSDRTHLIELSLRCTRGRDLSLDCSALDRDTWQRLSRAAYFRSSERTFDGRCDLLPMLETGLRTAGAWWSKVRKRFAAFDLSIHLLLEPEDEATERLGPTISSVAALAALMNDVLERRLPVEGGYAAWKQRVELSFGSEKPLILHWDGNPYQSKTRRRVISRKAEPALWAEVATAVSRDEAFVQGCGALTLTVAGDHLDWVRRSVREDRPDDEMVP